MRNNNVLGVIFCNNGERNVPELTAHRALGSVPFGCRYRLVDFALSNCVNAGISKVGLVTSYNYNSLADHVGNGSYWDLARKMGGLHILAPSLFTNMSMPRGKVDALNSCMDFFAHTKEEYVLCSEASVISNMDLENFIESHIASGAEITVAYKKGIESSYYISETGGRITEFSKTPNGSTKAYVGMFILRRDLFISLIQEAMGHNYIDLVTDILHRKSGELNISSFPVKESVLIVDSLRKYYEVSMSLISDGALRRELFNMDRPIYTKLRDNMPCRCGFESSVSNSMIADGCVIDGEVKNSIIFRGVVVEKGAKVENCILMQSTKIESGASIQNVITDKNVVVHEGRVLMGSSSFPIVVGKNGVV